MRADSPRLPGGGGTSAPSSGGGHVGPDHVIRRRNALEVKVHGVGGFGGGQTRPRKLRLASGLTTCWARLPPAPPTAPVDSPPQPGPPTGASHHTTFHRPLRSVLDSALRAPAQGSTSKGVLFLGGSVAVPGHLRGPISAKCPTGRFPHASSPSQDTLHFIACRPFLEFSQASRAQTGRLPPEFSVSPVEALDTLIAFIPHTESSGSWEPTFR